MTAKKKYDFASLKNTGDLIGVTCKSEVADSVAYNLKHAWQMYKKRNKIVASYRITKVIGAVIFTRTK